MLSAIRRRARRGAALHLDSGTLTPLLKRMERDGLVSRTRSEADERCVMVSATEKGEALRARAGQIPQKIAGCIRLSPEEAATLYGLLYKLLRDDGEGRGEAAQP